MIREILTRLPGALLVPLMLACGDPSGVESPPSVASVTVVTTPAGGTIEVGGTATVAATPLDAAGRALSGRPVAFTSSAPAVASVSAAGVATAVAPGTTTITATSGGKSAQAVLTVVAPAAPPRVVASVTLDATAITLEGGTTRQLVATPRDAEGEPIAGLTLTWTTSDAAVATVSGTGVVTALEMGAATITATVRGKSAPSAVVVLGSSPFDLLLDRWGATAGGLTRPSLHRLDLRTPGAVPASILEIAGSSDASPSPDGSRIAFTCASDFGPSICVVDRDGGNFAELTSTSSLLADQPAWSPDGTRIAFRGWAPGGSPGPFNPSRIWVMNADGSGKVELTGGAGATGWQQSPTWSPRQPDDSYRIAYSQQRTSGAFIVGGIHSMRADGSDSRPVTAAGEQLDDEPAWSPDGQTIAFVRIGAAANGELWLVQGVGGGERALMATDPAGVQRTPAWSPDGQLIAFSSAYDIEAAGTTDQIYTVRADGTHLLQRTLGGAEKRNPAWLKR